MDAARVWGVRIVFGVTATVFLMIGLIVMVKGGQSDRLAVPCGGIAVILSLPLIVLACCARWFAARWGAREEIEEALSRGSEYEIRRVASRIIAQRETYRRNALIRYRQEALVLGGCERYLAVEILDRIDLDWPRAVAELFRNLVIEGWRHNRDGDVEQARWRELLRRSGPPPRLDLAPLQAACREAVEQYDGSLKQRVEYLQSIAPDSTGTSFFAEDAAFVPRLAAQLRERAHPDTRPDPSKHLFEVVERLKKVTPEDANISVHSVDEAPVMRAVMIAEWKFRLEIIRRAIKDPKVPVSSDVLHDLADVRYVGLTECVGSVTAKWSVTTEARDSTDEESGRTVYASDINGSYYDGEKNMYFVVNNYSKCEDVMGVVGVLDCSALQRTVLTRMKVAKARRTVE